MHIDDQELHFWRVQPRDLPTIKASPMISGLSKLMTSNSVRIQVRKFGKLYSLDNEIQEGAVNLLCTILTSFPSSLQKNYDSAESAIVTKLMSGKCNTNLVKKLAVCLSLLPKSRGDADSWSLMMQVLIAEDIVNNASIDLNISWCFSVILRLCNGAGMSLYIAEDIVNNASIDLDSGEAYSESVQRKRKHEMTFTPFGNQPQEFYLPKNPVPTVVKIAALEALETLLTLGGASGSDSWRSSVDSLVITVATDACNDGWTKPANDLNNSANSSSNWTDFQLASLRALLASLLSPGRIRPPYLAHGLELFRKGRRETRTKLAEFCAQAIMALEVLIHPRAIPLINFGSSIEYPANGVKNSFSGSQKQNVFPGGASRNEPESEDDDLYEKWVKDNDANQPPAAEKNETTPQLTENAVSIEAPSGAEVATENKGKGILVETQSVEEANNKQSEIASQTVDFHASDNMVTGDVETKGEPAVASGSVGGMDFKFDLGGNDDDDPMDEIPDIVDVEPDSDEE